MCSSDLDSKPLPRQPQATGSVPGQVPQAVATPSQSALPPASVTLPENVPPVTGPTVPGYNPLNPSNDQPLPVTGRLARALNLPVQQPAARQNTGSFAPLRGSINSGLTSGLNGGFADWVSNNRLAGNFRGSSEPADPDSIFGVNVIRAPQGERGRPILAAEGMQRRTAPVQTAAIAAPGGGEAPRFNPAAGQTPAARRERIAMNVDGLPSVMTRGPQAAAIDDAAVPGRTPSPGRTAAPTTPGMLPPPGAAQGQGLPSAGGSDPSFTIDSLPMGADGLPPGAYDGVTEQGQMPMQGDPGMWMGEYPGQVHVESFYDDPYACEDEECGCLPLWCCDGRICAWLRRFGRPYYGWRWYRDFTASAGITGFQNQTDLGLNGNFGTNEYLNWAMPFWNAFGIGWQVGVRGVQSNYQGTTVDVQTAPGTTERIFQKGARDQQFVTTGFFTRAFEGRGLQGGAAYDYLNDTWFGNADVAQIRSELSYVWGYHEFGYWGANNVTAMQGVFAPKRHYTGQLTTVDLYTAFYRLQFGDANEFKFWGGATAYGDGIIGSLIRAPMSRSLAMEGTFTYLIPKGSQTTAINDLGTNTVTYSPAAWNVSVNLVYYPAGRSRRSLASPYRPLFDVADNGSMIRAFRQNP